VIRNLGRQSADDHVRVADRFHLVHLVAINRRVAHAASRRHITTVYDIWVKTRCESWERTPSDTKFDVASRHQQRCSFSRNGHQIRETTERIEYKLLSLTYRVLTTTQPPYLHHLISVQPPRSTRSSSLVTLARPPTSSSLRITDHSFRYASNCLWNQLPSSLPQPHLSSSVSVLPVHAPATSSHSVNSPFTIHNSLSLSLPPQDLPLSQIFATTDSQAQD